MAISDNSSVEYESGQTLNDWEAMTTTDRTTFNSSGSPWSRKSGFVADVKPYGLATGGTITPAASGANNQIDIAACTAYMALESGANASGLVSVSASANVTCSRPSSGTHLIHAITINNSGAYVVIAGNEGTSFSTTRMADGGPPIIPEDSIEIGHVRYSSQSAAAVTTNDIQQVPGTSQERFDNPGWSVDAVNGQITFYQTLPAIHDDGESPTGGQAKQVAVQFYTPVFATLERSSDWTPAEQTHSTNTTQTYDGPVGSVSSTINQASWTSLLGDGTTDTILSQKDQIIWIRFKQDRNGNPYQLTNGKLGVSRSFTVNEQVSCDFTLAAEAETTSFAS